MQVCFISSYITMCYSKGGTQNVIIDIRGILSGTMHIYDSNPIDINGSRLGSPFTSTILTPSNVT